MNKDYNNIPANACTFAAPIELRDNGDGSTSAPFEILARSSQPIEHWFWGRVVHDGSGAFGKERIPIDYNHDEVIGFANKRRLSTEGVHLSGALVSVKEGDRADMVMKQARAGIPFEASINFGGDGIKLEEVPEGKTSHVNGYEFAGPGIIVREWPMRGCAFCPYGADGNTKTELFSDGTKFSATIVHTEQETVEMPEAKDQKADEVVEAAVEIAQDDTVEAVEAESATELSEAVEEEVVEVAVAAVEAVEAEAEQVEEVQFSRSEIVKMHTEFGADIALQVMTNGGNYEDARELHHQAEKAELESLRKQVAEFKASKQVASGATPIAFADGEKRKPTPKKLRNASFTAQ